LGELVAALGLAQTAYNEVETQYNDLWAQALDTDTSVDTVAYDALVG